MPVKDLLVFNESGALGIGELVAKMLGLQQVQKVQAVRISIEEVGELRKLDLFRHSIAHRSCQF